MKIPSNMTEEEVVQLIQLVSKRISHKYTFGTYDRDDIEQEAFILAMDALERYDESLPLENFLVTHIRNRLFNLRRKEHYTIKPNQELSDNDEKKRKLLEPISIGNVRDHNESNMMYNDSTLDETTIAEIELLIDVFLDTSYRLDYIKIKDNVYVSKSRREEIFTEIRNILKRNGYEPEDWGEYE